LVIIAVGTITVSIMKTIFRVLSLPLAQQRKMERSIIIIKKQKRMTYVAAIRPPVAHEPGASAVDPSQPQIARYLNSSSAVHRRDDGHRARKRCVHDAHVCLGFGAIERHVDT
jgi:hypothetical protein